MAANCGIELGTMTDSETKTLAETIAFLEKQVGFSKPGTAYGDGLRSAVVLLKAYQALLSASSPVDVPAGTAIEFQVEQQELFPLSDWHEDDGPAVWWLFPLSEAAWIGSPLDDNWPGYHTHWTRHPRVPTDPQEKQ